MLWSETWKLSDQSRFCHRDDRLDSSSGIARERVLLIDKGTEGIRHAQLMKRKGKDLSHSHIIYQTFTKEMNPLMSLLLFTIQTQ
jgi:hypothetical protein